MMLPNEIDYDIYYAGGCHERPLLRRQSWPRGSAAATDTGTDARIGPRQLVGRALIGLGQMIAPEMSVTAAPRAATNGR